MLSSPGPAPYTPPVNESDYADLLRRWKDGDPDAGNQLCQQHFKEIRRFFENKVNAEVDDLVQSTFLACVQSRDRFRGESTFRTFLFSIARYQLYNHLRRFKKNDVLDFTITSLTSLDTGPITYAGRNEEREQLTRALVELPLEQQMLIELHYWEDMKLSDLADVFEVAEPTVRTRLHRARKALKDMLAKAGVRQDIE